MPPKKNKSLSFVVVKNTAYGKLLNGTKIYYEGKRPNKLAKDGKITFGKNILEILRKKFSKFQWIVTIETDSIERTYGIHRVRTSIRTLNKMYTENIHRSKDIKTDLISANFSKIYPDHFTGIVTTAYVPGTVSKLLDPAMVSKLSSDDRDALNKFIPAFISSESVGAINVLKAEAQIKTLKDMAAELKESLTKDYSESTWQSYIKQNILIIQQGYIAAIDKMNTIVGGTKFPDFSLVTHDSFLDILEIKKPTTELLREDKSRGNYYWDTEISKAISQVENYIENVSNQASAIRGFVKDNHNIELKVVRPRGIILAGDNSTLSSQKQKDDFRLLTQASKNIVFVTYDELLTRLENYIKVLEAHSVKPLPATKPSKPKAIRANK